ncbi:hypothetical protein P7K49_017522 [Saguinus oedipus]|uniref:Uncharacterized protein n=1 Tax=Saguinus oedipus TaxID=9490 RepID=A0ABQ9V365_SAGOE|nr:hypothetical protein P7K49_017522 [Saguinus oedipus]
MRGLGQYAYVNLSLRETLAGHLPRPGMDPGPAVTSARGASQQFLIRGAPPAPPPRGYKRPRAPSARPPRSERALGEVRKDTVEAGPGRCCGRGAEAVHYIGSRVRAPRASSGRRVTHPRSALRSAWTTRWLPGAAAFPRFTQPDLHERGAALLYRTSLRFTKLPAGSDGDSS